MLTCEKCGENNGDNSKICVRCWHKLGTVVLPDDKVNAEEIPRKLTPRNYFVAISYVVLASLGGWLAHGANDGFLGLLRGATIIVALAVLWIIVVATDSQSPRNPRNRPVLRTLLCAIVLGGAAFVVGIPGHFWILFAAIGGIFGALGWRWIKHASI